MITPISLDQELVTAAKLANGITIVETGTLWAQS